MDLSDLRVYKTAMDLGEKIWAHAHTWDRLSKDTIGKQVIRSADSIAANISEGHGRFHFKENRNFCYFARGSLFETKTWLQKAMQRNLISPQEFMSLNAELDILAKMLNKYIHSIGQ